MTTSNELKSNVSAIAMVQAADRSKKDPTKTNEAFAALSKKALELLKGADDLAKRVVTKTTELVVVLVSMEKLQKFLLTKEQIQTGGDHLKAYKEAALIAAFGTDFSDQGEAQMKSRALNAMTLASTVVYSKVMFTSENYPSGVDSKGNQFAVQNTEETRKKYGVTPVAELDPFVWIGIEKFGDLSKKFLAKKGETDRKSKAVAVSNFNKAAEALIKFGIGKLTKTEREEVQKTAAKVLYAIKKIGVKVDAKMNKGTNKKTNKKTASK